MSQVNSAPEAAARLVPRLQQQLIGLERRSLSENTRRQIDTLREQLDEALVRLQANDGSASNLVIQLEQRVSTLVSQVEQRLLPTPAAAVLIRVIGLARYDLDDLQAAIRSTFDSVSEFLRSAEQQEQVEAMGFQSPQVQLIGSDLAVVWRETEASSLAVDYAFALALYVHSQVSVSQSPTVAVVLRDEEFAEFDGVGLIEPAISGAPLAQASILTNAMTTSSLVVTDPVLNRLRRTFGLRAGRDLPGQRMVSRLRELTSRQVPGLLGSPGDHLVDCVPIVGRGDGHAHAVQVRLQGSNTTAVGSLPQPERQVTIRYRPAPDSIEPEFFSRLVEADEVEIAGVTNQRLAKTLDEACEERTRLGLGPWESLRVFFPSERILGKLDTGSVNANERSQQWHAGGKTVRFLLGSLGKEIAHLSACLVHDLSPVPVGARFVAGGATSFTVGLPLVGYPAHLYPYFPTADGRPGLPSGNGRSVDEQLEHVFATLRTQSVKFDEREAWGSIVGTGRGRRITLEQLASDDPSIVGESLAGPWAPRELHLATALIILHAQSGPQRCLLLQGRTKFNARDSHGTFSNLTAALVESDLYKTRASDANPIVPLPSPAPATVSDETATTWLYQWLKWESPGEIPREAFITAAQRECLSSLGLDVAAERFVHQRSASIENRGKRLYFDIFSLLLERQPTDEVGRIEKLRPHANLQFVSREQVDKYSHEGRLNDFLRSELNNVFHPIFDFLDLG